MTTPWWGWRRAALAFLLALAMVGPLCTAAVRAQDEAEEEGAGQRPSREGGARKEPYRDPTAAAVRSVVFPGWGQHYNGEGTKGTVFTFGVGTGALFAFEVLQLASTERGQEFERGVGVAIMALVWTWSVVDAYTAAPRINAENGYDLDVLLPRESGVRVALVHARF